MDNTAQFNPEFVAGVKLIVTFLEEEGYNGVSGAVMHDGRLFKVTVTEMKEDENDEISTPPVSI